MVYGLVWRQLFEDAGNAYLGPRSGDEVIAETAGMARRYLLGGRQRQRPVLTSASNCPFPVRGM